MSNSTQNDWESQLSKSLKSMGLGMSGSQAEWIFDFVRQQRADARKEGYEEGVMAMAKNCEKRNKRMFRGLSEGMYIKTAKELLATLKEETNV